MKVSIIGHGFVGKALELGLNDNIEKLIIDPIYKNNISEISNFNPSIIFICVPTPMYDDGNQDLNILNNVLAELKNTDTESSIVLKSTVLPSGIQNIENLFPEIVYNPEFLTEKNSVNDFINADQIILGGKRDNTSKISLFYKKHTKCITNNYIFTDLITASFVKYAINCFLASKVIFFNELNQLFINSDTNEKWENFLDMMSSDSRIGDSHMQVPGPDGRYGFGGACFPKDAEAFYKYSVLMESPLNLLKKVIDLNKDIRNTYDNLTGREIDQNINFSSKD